MFEVLARRVGPKLRTLLKPRHCALGTKELLILGAERQGLSDTRTHYIVVLTKSNADEKYRSCWFKYKSKSAKAESDLNLTKWS